MNRNGKLNVQRGYGDIGSAQIKVAPPANAGAATATARLQGTAQPTALPTRNPQVAGRGTLAQRTANTRMTQGGYGVSGQKLQGTPGEGGTLTGKRVKLR